MAGNSDIDRQRAPLHSCAPGDRPRAARRTDCNEPRCFAIDRGPFDVALCLGAAANFVFQRDIAHLQHRTDVEQCLIVNAFAVDVGAVGRIEVVDAQLVAGELDLAMQARDARVGDDDVGGAVRPILTPSGLMMNRFSTLSPTVSSRQWNSSLNASKSPER